MQVMDLQVEYHYYTMCTLQDMDLNQEFNQSVMDRRTRVTLYITSTFVMGYKNCFLDTGECKTTLKKHVPGSLEWARLEDGETISVGQYIKNLTTNHIDNMCLFDWSLPINCSQLANELTIPKYFAGELTYLLIVQNYPRNGLKLSLTYLDTPILIY